MTSADTVIVTQAFWWHHTEKIWLHHSASDSAAWDKQTSAPSGTTMQL